MHDIDLDNIPKNFTELIIKNKTFLSDLKKHGLDEKQIRKILKNYHGLDLYSCGFRSERKKGWIKTEDLPEHTVQAICLSLEPDTLTPFNITDKKFQKDVDYAIRKISTLLNNPVISGEIKSALTKKTNGLEKIRKRCGHKPRPERLLHPGEKDMAPKARSITQMTGFQVVCLYDYIRPIAEKTDRQMIAASPAHKPYREKDIFSFICEILNATDDLKPYTEKGIKSLYFNHYNKIGNLV